ncbi:hypothetical protein [Streptomyces sp. NPDC006551]|uniref:hypothetical protein n=1 Tax=Streptomyces sp. NPDC006551 TaxID=3157178 RepID=UPI0033ACDAFC
MREPGDVLPYLTAAHAGADEALLAEDVGGVGKYRRTCTHIAEQGYPGVELDGTTVARRIGRIDEEIAAVPFLAPVRRGVKSSRPAPGTPSTWA